jgi:hypothetical protein
MLKGPTYLALALVAVASATATAQTLQVQTTCRGNSACAKMTIDAASPAELTVVGPQNTAGYTMFELRVRGALAGEPETEHRLRLSGYTDGIQCGRFGQATAAVVGHGTGGAPVVLTDRGPLEIRDTVLEVGCRACAHIHEASTERLVATLRTPGWDLTLAGTNEDSLVVTDNGELVFLTQGRFLQLSAAGPFRWVSQPRPTRRYRLELVRGACS